MYILEVEEPPTASIIICPFNSCNPCMERKKMSDINNDIQGSKASPGKTAPTSEHKLFSVNSQRPLMVLQEKEIDSDI